VKLERIITFTKELRKKLEIKTIKNEVNMPIKKRGQIVIIKGGEKKEGKIKRFTDDKPNHH
jgi:hypothetical protein